MSKSAFLSGNGSRMLMNAPKVPKRKGGGIGMKYGSDSVDLSATGHEVVGEFVEPEDRHHRDREVDRPPEKVRPREGVAPDVREPDQGPREGRGPYGRGEEQEVDPLPLRTELRARDHFDVVLPHLVPEDRDVAGRPELAPEAVEPSLEGGGVELDGEQERLGTDPNVIDPEHRADDPPDLVELRASGGGERTRRRAPHGASPPPRLPWPTSEGASRAPSRCSR